jgi:hypothetical protein
MPTRRRKEILYISCEEILVHAKDIYKLIIYSGQLFVYQCARRAINNHEYTHFVSQSITYTIYNNYLDHALLINATSGLKKFDLTFNNFFNNYYYLFYIQNCNYRCSTSIGVSS